MPVPIAGEVANRVFQTRLEGFFMTPIITGPANFDVLIVDSMGKPNHKVAENITK